MCVFTCIHIKGNLCCQQKTPKHGRLTPLKGIFSMLHSRDDKIQYLKEIILQYQPFRINKPASKKSKV